MKKIIKWLERIIFVALVIVFVYSGYHVFSTWYDNYKQDKENAEIADDINVPDASNEEDLDNFTIDFDYLKDRYPNVVGWIVVEDTSISYPIVQGTDNVYYLDHTYAGTENYAGSIFMDYRASSDFSDQNTFIYGHNVYHGTMFAELANYVDADFFNKHPYIYLYTREGNYKMQVFSAYVDTTDSAGYQMYFSDDASFQTYLNTVKSMSRVANDVSVSASDRIVTLYTCSYENGNNPDNTDVEDIDERYFIHCKLIKELD